jgi:hypothetical protein
VHLKGCMDTENTLPPVFLDLSPVRPPRPGDICPKCGKEDIAVDHEYYYCEACGHVWAIEW